MTFPISRRIFAASLAVLFVGALVPTTEAADAQLAHAVYFTLKDQSPESREAFVAICEKYLTGHPGTTSCSIGTIAEDVKEAGVSDRAFDVSLHIVFENRAALATYIKSERHVQFGAAIKGKPSKVRVFDSYLSSPKATSAAK